METASRPFQSYRFLVSRLRKIFAAFLALTSTGFSQSEEAALQQILEESNSNPAALRRLDQAPIQQIFEPLRHLWLQNETIATSGTEPTPERSVWRKKLAARKGARPRRILSIVSVTVWIINQKIPPISRRKPRPFCPISWTTTTGLVSMGPLESELRCSSAMCRWKLPQFPHVQRGKYSVSSRSRSPNAREKEILS